MFLFKVLFREKQSLKTSRLVMNFLVNKKTSFLISPKSGVTLFLQFTTRMDSFKYKVAVRSRFSNLKYSTVFICRNPNTVMTKSGYCQRLQVLLISINQSWELGASLKKKKQHCFQTPKRRHLIIAPKSIKVNRLPLILSIILILAVFIMCK